MAERSDDPTPKHQTDLRGSVAAPVIYFDGVAALGHWNGVLQIELAVNTLLPIPGGEVTSEIVAAAHLRTTPAGLAALKDAIQKIETLTTPNDAKPN